MSTSFVSPVTRSVHPWITSMSVHNCGEGRIIMDPDRHHGKIVRDLRGKPVVTLPCTGKDPVFCHEPLVAAHVHVEEIDLVLCLSLDGLGNFPACTTAYPGISPKMVRMVHASASY